MKILHHHRAEIALNRPSTQTEVEVEVVVQAKDVVVVVATRIKASSNISQMMHRGQMHVEEEIIEAGGVKEVAEISKETMQEMIAENAGIVEEQVTFKVNVHQEIKGTGDSKITMRLPAAMSMIQRGCL